MNNKADLRSFQQLKINQRDMIFDPHLWPLFSYRTPQCILQESIDTAFCLNHARKRRAGQLPMLMHSCENSFHSRSKAQIFLAHTSGQLAPTPL